MVRSSGLESGLSGSQCVQTWSDVSTEKPPQISTSRVQPGEDWLAIRFHPIEPFGSEGCPKRNLKTQGSKRWFSDPKLVQNALGSEQRPNLICIPGYEAKPQGQKSAWSRTPKSSRTEEAHFTPNW